MSYTIENLKFTIFGHGHDVTRNDSGQGVVSNELDLTVYSAVFNESGEYAWLEVLGTDNTLHLKKYKTSNWTEVEHEVPDGIYVLHPNNVSNDYGIVFVDIDTAYVFNLTDDTVIGEVTGSGFPYAVGITTYDCIFVEDKIHIVRKLLGNTNTDLWTIDLNNMSFSSSNIQENVECCGFIDDSHLYTRYQREWFYQTSMAYCITLGGSVVWSNTGTDNNSNLSPYGPVGNGKLYLPVYTDEAWHFGEFNGISNPTLQPVTPNRVFGNFDACPALTAHMGINDRNHHVVYTDGRTKALLLTTKGLLLTDFSEVNTIRDDMNAIPLALSDNYVLCSDYGSNKLYIYGY